MKAYILVKSFVAGSDNHMPNWYIAEVFLNKQDAEDRKQALMKARTDLNDVWFVVERDCNK